MDYIKRHLLTHEDKITNYIICAQNPAHTRHLIHPVNTKHNLLTLSTSLGHSTLLINSTSLWLSTWLRHSLLISVKKFEPYIDSFTLIYHNIYILYDNRFTITIFIPTHSNSTLMERNVHSFCMAIASHSHLHSYLINQNIHTLIDHHIHILYGNSYTFKKKFIPAHSNLMDQYIHTLIDHHIHILYGNSYTFKKFHTDTFKFYGPIHCHSFITTFTFCMATATHSKFIPAHSNLMDQYIHTLIYLHIHILYGNS